MPKPSGSRRSKVKQNPAKPARRRTVPAESVAVTDAEAHIDGCDVEFTEMGTTPDTELPAAQGGVESRRTTQRRISPQRQRRR